LVGTRAQGEGFHSSFEAEEALSAWMLAYGIDCYS